MTNGCGLFLAHQTSFMSLVEINEILHFADAVISYVSKIFTYPWFSNRILI
jgi:hypothetical protein